MGLLLVEKVLPQLVDELYLAKRLGCIGIRGMNMSQVLAALLPQPNAEVGHGGKRYKKEPLS